MNVDELRDVLEELENDIAAKQQERAEVDANARAEIVALQRERDTVIGDIKAAQHLATLSAAERESLAAALKDKG